MYRFTYIFSFFALIIAIYSLYLVEQEQQQQKCFAINSNLAALLFEYQNILEEEEKNSFRQEFPDLIFSLEKETGCEFNKIKKIFIGEKK
jgi:hypothetical protein